MPVVESGLDDPWAMAFLSDGRMLVTERAGRLRIIAADGHLLSEAITGIPPVLGGEGGFLAVLAHPQYSQAGNSWIYLTYGDKSSNGLGWRRSFADACETDNVSMDNKYSRPILLSIVQAAHALVHACCLTVIATCSSLKATERIRETSRILHARTERFIALTTTVAFPQDHPFVNRVGALPSIWTYGHRNSQGLAFSP